MKPQFASTFFLAVAVAILGPMLLPGYVLTLDMVWPDTLKLSLSTDGFLNALPLSLLLTGLGTLFPSWVVQKIMLIALFFALLYLPYRLLPYIPSWEGRLFAGLIYTLNPFVYSRMLSGQWMVLLGYALMPLVLYALVRITERKDIRSGFVLAGALLAVGAVSIHFFYLAILLSGVWISTHTLKELLTRHRKNSAQLIRATLISVALVCMVSMYWIIPALMRTTPIEARFDTAHVSGFSASENHLIPTMLNVLVLGGFWAEGMGWRYTFVWPQDMVLFWVSSFMLLILVGHGVQILIRNRETRFVGILLLGIAVLSYILALGVWGGLFSTFNAWWYAHMPGWSGLRDSHKVAGILALVYAMCAGIAVSTLTQRFKGTYMHTIRTLALCTIPVCFGIYHWFGFHAQLNPVWYPHTWYEARALLAPTPTEEKVLTLPWRGYYSLEFADQRIIGNATSFFGAERILSGRSVEVGGVYDQEVDTHYRTLDSLLHSIDTHTTEELTRRFAQLNIRYVLFVHNSRATSPWLLPPAREGDITLSDEVYMMALTSMPHTVLLDTSDLMLIELQ